LEAYRSENNSNQKSELWYYKLRKNKGRHLEKKNKMQEKKNNNQKKKIKNE
jgi:hypothetical protein